jgi:flagellar hook-basal body complex protein FliE
MNELLIGKLNPNLKVPEIRRPGEGQKGAGNFGDVLKDAISTVNDLQKQSDTAIGQLMSGENQDIHSTLIAVQKADLSFQTMMQVRNKIVAAYQEIMRIQV